MERPKAQSKDHVWRPVVRTVRLHLLESACPAVAKIQDKAQMPTGPSFPMSQLLDKSIKRNSPLPGEPPGMSAGSEAKEN